MNSIKADQWRGGEKWMVNAADGLAKRGHKVICVGRNEALWLQKASQRGLLIKELPIHGDFDPIMVGRLFAFFKKEQIDVLCCNFEKDVRLGGIAGKLAGVPCIYSRKGLCLMYEKIRYKLAYQYVVQEIITPAQFIKDDFKRFSWLQQKNIHVVHNGVEIPDLSRFDKIKLKTITSIPDNDRVIFAAGSLCAQKGFEYLINACKLIMDNERQVHLAIAGNGDQTPYRALAQELGISQNVHFLGHRDDIRELMFGADIFVLSSIDEGLPNVVLEAMSMGIPVVAANAGGTTEIIRDGIDGFVVPIKDAPAIAEKVLMILRDEELSDSFKKNGREKIIREFSMDVMVNSVESLFKHSLLRSCRNKKYIG